MGFEDRFRFSVHAVITGPDERNVLMLRQSYGDNEWGLPGGSVEPAETIIDALIREAEEELGCRPRILALTGWYYHSKVEAQVGIFRCELPEASQIRLSAEHTEFRWTPIDELADAQQIRVRAAIAYDGSIHAAVF